MTGTHEFDWGTFSDSEPFSGLLPESDYPLIFPGGTRFNSTGRVYAVDAKNKHLIPPNPEFMLYVKKNHLEGGQFTVAEQEI
ncbi:hypothetical protein BMI88_01960 [Thioclava sp. F36-6]|nr:hypothetical protein BMI88_01960 [Thioclava sp. F36-6]